MSNQSSSNFTDFYWNKKKPENLNVTAPVGVSDSSQEIFRRYQPESPIVMTAANLGVPVKTDGLLYPDGITLPPLSATMSCGSYAGDRLAPVNARYGPINAPSLVQPPTFVSGNSLTGATLTTMSFSHDTNLTSSTWKLTIAPGGCWQSPFHSHSAEEQWVVTAGQWIFRYFDYSLYWTGAPAYKKILLPGETPGMNSGADIQFNDTEITTATPNGPNTSIVLSPGDVFMMKRGSWFEWGSSVANAQIVATWFNPGTAGAVNWVTHALQLYLDGTITECQFNQYLAIFQPTFLTAFV